MSSPTRHSLDVPGARLYYEVRGSGPALMLVGHPMGAAGFASIAPLLAEDYTVVTYDPRGFARSTIDDPDQDAEPDLLADEVVVMTAAPGRVKARYDVTLPRPRVVEEVRADPRFGELYRAMWADLRSEVLESYARANAAT